MTEFFKGPDGAKLAYTRKGAGRPLICLSGLTRNHSDFDYLAPHLDGVEMICLDYRGRGSSAWTGGETYSVPIEMQDVIALLDHLELQNAPFLGTSRGGIIGMVMAAAAPDRISALCLNDIGPELMKSGLDGIKDYVGRHPSAKTHAEAAQTMATRMAGFDGVSDARWLEEAQKHYIEEAGGLKINYDPALRDLVVAPAPDVNLWPYFDALAGKPLALIRGANSDLLSEQTRDEMIQKRPDMLLTDVPGRGHIPFLDEPKALGVIHQWLKML
ncbi:MAG: alpha/beta hydrolase [Litoreibacter sp.]